MKCFIAMAFGRSDTDKVYDDLICSVLKERGITPVRVDRLEHNENIDDKIMQGLREADFVIADLTYARPSVYYEAGFAESRPVPVIYTVRRDHFAQRTDDPFGNLRVHFDLQMRNIIDWTDTLDLLFRTRLRDRVDYVLAPIIEKNKSTGAVTLARERFSARSYKERCSLVQKTIDTVLQSSEFDGLLSPGDMEKPNNTREQMIGNTHHVVECHFSELSGKPIENWYPYLYHYTGLWGLDINLDGSINRDLIFKYHHIVCCLESITAKDLERVFPDYDRKPGTNAIQKVTYQDIPVIPFEVSGPVFYPVVGTTSLWSGGVKKGACVSNPPAHLVCSDPEKARNGYKVIDCKTRRVESLETYQFIESILSIEELTPRLILCIRNALES